LKECMCKRALELSYPKQKNNKDQSIKAR